MSNNHRHLGTGLAKVMALFLAFAWVAADAAVADQSRAGSTRSGTGSSSSSSSGSVSSGSGSSGSRAPAVHSSSSSAQRTAVPRSGSRGGSGAARTRPHSGGSVRPGGGSHYGGYHHGGSHFYGRVGFGWGYPGYWSPFWGFWGPSWGFGWGPGWGYPAPVVYSSHRGWGMGALDLKVRPKDTEIYVDGQYVGLARQYDGFPGHLWLERGVYEIGFYRPGFETQLRTVKILPDLILDIDVQMYDGVAVKPEMRFAPAGREDRGNEIGEEYGEERGDEYARRAPQRERPAVVAQARMHLAVEPGSAAVYLDGHLLGTGDELAGLHAGLILSAGPHTLEISQEGFETLEERIVVDAGEEVDLTFALRRLGRAGL
ncbi:MAG: PEGA domain-containing protein [Acidobacteriota bacterium]|nr:PEGA domain-containing protein [Acidobacteriota bacterium]